MLKTVAASVVSTLLFAGCAPHMAVNGEPVITRAASCKSANSAADCYILVDAWLNSDGTCSAEVVKSQITVGFNKDAKDKWVEWKFTESAEDDGFRFPDNGIEPKATPEGNAERWARNFGTQGGAESHGKRFKRKNKNDPAVLNAIDYFYTVNVELRRPHLAPLACKPQDPVIKNVR